MNRSTLNNWINGNTSSLDREELIQLAIFFEQGSPEDIIEDEEEDQ